MGDPTYRIRLFGGFALERSAEDLVSSLPQRRPQAVAAILAVCGDLGCTRERLLGLLWPESDEARARHNLRDALYSLRRALGHDAVLSPGDTLRLDAAVVGSDVREFADALTAARLADAVDLYRGPLLDGFHIDGSAAFERWVDDERARLFRERQQAVKRLAKKAEHEARWDAAADWWDRAIAADRYNSRLVVRRMVALTRAGDRANAIQEGEAHVRLLMEELELESDAAFLEELDRIRSGELGAAHFFTPAPFRPDLPRERDRDP